MKTIKTTHIDTGGHGYLSVSKKDFLKVLKPEQITGCSGHNLTRMYLEEDCDASLYMDEAEKKGFKVDVKSGYNLGFKVTHNFDPKMFHYQPKVGDEIQLTDEMWYKIIGETGTKWIVSNQWNRYGIPMNNPFEYIKSARGMGVLAFKVENLAQVIGNQI